MAKNYIQNLLESSGIIINGDRPWDLKILNENFYDRLLSQGGIALGESYMEGWWECEQIDEMISKVLTGKLDQKFSTWRLALDSVKAKLFNLQKKSKAFKNAGTHYNIGNDLYERMLDRRMVYSCAYWDGAKTLDEAQENKLDLICKKIELKPGMKVLDIGCGWGSLLKFIAEKYDIKSVGITVSENQCKLAKKNCAGLPIDIQLQDYRDHSGKYDRIVSVGMFEHVGFKNYPKFMNVAHRCLKNDGFFLLHTIGSNQSMTRINPWFQKYIFPNAMIPSIKQIGDAIEGLFVMEDWHNFGPDYDKTLMAWFSNFDSHWEELKQRYGETFYRMWKFYLLSCAGTFRARENQVWQILMTQRGARPPRVRKKFEEYPE